MGTSTGQVSATLGFFMSNGTNKGTGTFTLEPSDGSCLTPATPAASGLSADGTASTAAAIASSLLKAWPNTPKNNNNNANKKKGPPPKKGGDKKGDPKKKAEDAKKK